MNSTKSLILLTVAFLFSLSAYAQRGVGDPTGIVRQGLATESATISGTLKEIQTGPCENTTGRALIGTHLIVETDKGEEVNIHLGATSAVDVMTRQLTAGQQLTIEAFRTQNMPENAYAARTITTGDHTFTLRGEDLRPFWAGGAAIGTGQGVGRSQGFRRGAGAARAGGRRGGWCRR